MNSNKKYMKPQKTIGYLSLSKQFPIYKKTPTKKLIQDRYPKNKYINNSNIEINNSNINNEYQFLSKYISKKKFQGVLDINAPGNKDVLIDSDSEIPKNLDGDGDKNIYKKNGCAKLVIDKIESQVPKQNEEYYKFTNQRRILDRTKTEFLNKNNNIVNNMNRNKLFNNSALKKRIGIQRNYNNNSNDYNYDRYYLLSQTQVVNNGYEQDFNKNSLKGTYKNSSVKNIFNKDINFNIDRNNKFYNTGFTYNSKIGNNIIMNNDNTLITKSPDEYIQTIEDNSSNIIIRDNSPIFVNRNLFYEKEHSNTKNSKDTNYIDRNNNNKNSTRFYYIYKNRNNNLYRNRNISEESKKSTLFENYKDLIRMNTFSKLSNNKNNNKYILYPGFREKLIKIQSAWRGAYVRELMTFYWNLDNFKNILDKVIKNHLNDYFADFKHNLKNYKNIKKNKRQKYIFEKNNDKELNRYKKELNQKTEDYENLLKNYNSLVERCTELQHIVNQNNNNNILSKSENKKNNIIWKELNLDSNNNNLEMNIKDIEKKENNKINSKKFDIIQPEQKDKFDITSYYNKIIDIKNENNLENNNNNNITFRAKKNKKSNSMENVITLQYKSNKKKKEPNIIEKQEKIKFEGKKPKMKYNIIEKQGVIQFNNKTTKKIYNNIIEEQEKFQYGFEKPKKEPNIIEKQEIIQFNNYNPKIKNYIINKLEEIQYKNNKKNKYQECLEHYSSNLNLNNADKFFIEGEHKNKKNIIFEKSKYELSLINNKIKNNIINEICKIEDFNLINYPKEKIPIREITKGVVEISLINTKKEYINEIYHNDSINIIHNKIEKAPPNEICQNDSISLINNEIKQRIFDSKLLNKDNIIEILLINNEKNKHNNNKYELISEKQINTNIEIKGIEKEKFKNCIIDKQNDINIINIKNRNTFNGDLISINNEITVNINNKEKEEKKEILSKQNIIELIIENNSKTNNNIIVNKDEKYEIFENERFTINDSDINIFTRNNNEKSDFIEEKRDNISFNEIIENKKKEIEFTITNNDNLCITRIINTNDKNVEGKMNLNEDTINKNIIDNNDNANSNNNNKIVENKNEELSYVPKEMNENKQTINYNINNEIDKCEGLEINPYELNRTKNNENNIFISYENKIEVLDNKNSIFKEKAKKNMMKIILPIRLKTTLRDYIHRNIFPILICKLKKIAFLSHMNRVGNIMEKDIENEDIENNNN